jgi:membrane protease YdiL (CAAX protease family)
MARFWRRMPLLIRSLVSGVLIAEIGISVWLVAWALIPAPWPLVVMSGVLWLYCKYFSGSWWPKSTAEARRDRFRAAKLPVGVWKWSLAAAALFVVVSQSGLVVTFRIIAFPAEAFAAGYSVDGVPLWLAWLGILMASLVAGICEETGLRGYLQFPLERRYGPGVGITIASIVFVLLHLNQPWAATIILHLFVWSVLWGVLAYSSGSLIPSILGHAVMDILNFSYWWTDIAGSFEMQTLAKTGVDLHFIGWSLVLGASIALFLLAVRRAMAIRQQM